MNHGRFRVIKTLCTRFVLITNNALCVPCFSLQCICAYMLHSQLDRTLCFLFRDETCKLWCMKNTSLHHCVYLWWIVMLASPQCKDLFQRFQGIQWPQISRHEFFFSSRATIHVFLLMQDSLMLMYARTMDSCLEWSVWSKLSNLFLHATLLSMMLLLLVKFVLGNLQSFIYLWTTPLPRVFCHLVEALE